MRLILSMNWRNAAWYEAHKPERKISMAAWEKNNRAKRNLQAQQARLDNPEQAHARDRRADDKRREAKAVYNAEVLCGTS